jgi:hypothetical protein
MAQISKVIIDPLPTTIQNKEGRIFQSGEGYGAEPTFKLALDRLEGQIREKYRISK